MADPWKAWVDNILVSPTDQLKCSDNAGIYGLDGNPWSQSSNFNLTPQEVQDAIAVLNRGGGGNLTISNTKYIVLRTDGDLLVAKALKKGVTIAKAKTCVVIGQYEDHSTIQPGNNCTRVSTVQEQLVAHGY